MTHASATTIDSIKRSLVGLRMPRALEVLDTTLRRIEQGEIDGIGALDQILIEELTLRENRRVKTALLMARLTAIKTLQGFDFAFQPSLDRNRVLALAELKFIDRAGGVSRPFLLRGGFLIPASSISVTKRVAWLSPYGAATTLSSRRSTFDGMRTAL